ncbi:MAG: AbrB/MazE/SpoVT family DNA-binding domain-containing protein [Candidatus Diapherotrites archaeon]|nr:AbrB/MazE/SpoVT family DNA-binding domain-containing protein [Candidatus Diapherotrites archaeon]
MKCTKCSSKMEEKKDETPEGVSYTYFACTNCGEEIVDMKQLHSVAQKYRELKKYVATVSKWGESIAIRIPKELAEEYGLKPNKRVNLIPEKEAIKITA